MARGRDALPRDPGWQVSEARFRFPPCELTDGRGILAVSSFTGRATPDRAGARPYHLQWRITSLIACEPGSRVSASPTYDFGTCIWNRGIRATNGTL